MDDIMRRIYQSNRPTTAKNANFEITPEDAQFMTLWAVTDNYWLTNGDFADGTKNITYQLVRSLAHKLGDIELSEQWVARAVQQLQKEKKSKKSINTYMDAIKRVYVANGADKIAIPHSKTDDVEHYYYKLPATVEKLIRFGRTETQQAVIAFYYYQALRNTELTELKMKDLRMDSLEVNVYGKKTRKYRLIPLDPRLLPFLTKYLELRRTKFVPDLEAQGISEPSTLFVNELGRQFSDESTRQMVYRTARRAGFEGIDLEEAHPHILRHSRANHLIHHEGWDIATVAYFLGDTVGTVEKYYAHTGSNDCKRNMMKAMRR